VAEAEFEVVWKLLQLSYCTEFLDKYHEHQRDKRADSPPTYLLITVSIQLLI